MTLRTKILGGYGLVLVLLVLVALWALFNLSSLGRASDAILQENYQSIRAADNMIAAIERQDSAVLALLLGGDAAAVADFRQGEVTFLETLNQAFSNVTLEEEPAILEGIETSYVSYLDAVDGLRDELERDPEQALDTYYESVFPIFISVRDSCVRLRELNQNAMLAASDRSHDVARRAIWSTVAVGALAGAVGLFFSYLLSRRITRPLQQMTAATEKIAEGDYEVDLPAGSNDELGQLARKINLMSRRLKAFHELNVGQVIAAKQRSEAIVRNITEGIILVDAGNRIVTLNPMAAEIFGGDVDGAAGKHLFDFIGDKELYDYILGVAEGNPDDIYNYARPGTQRHYQVNVAPVRTEQGQTLGVVILLQDVTRLMELDRLKSEFVMTASHELRTPLTSIGMSIELLAESGDDLDQRQQALLEAAAEDTQRLRALVNDLLDLSRIESGQIEMARESISVSTLFEQALAHFQAAARQQDIGLKAELPEPDVKVRADADKIMLVLSNLIDNALRYTPPGGTIALSCVVTGRLAALSVADTGSGIPREYQSKIFDKFVQVKDGHTGSTGLGLALCREIVQAHGGSIWVDSTPGEGSTFSFTLPLADTQPAPGTSAPAAAATGEM